jgi:hypothetical protein
VCYEDSLAAEAIPLAGRAGRDKGERCHTYRSPFLAAQTCQTTSTSICLFEDQGQVEVVWRTDDVYVIHIP